MGKNECVGVHDGRSNPPTRVQGGDAGGRQDECQEVGHAKLHKEGMIVQNGVRRKGNVTGSAGVLV